MSKTIYLRIEATAFFMAVISSTAEAIKPGEMPALYLSTMLTSATLRLMLLSSCATKSCQKNKAHQHVGLLNETKQNYDDSNDNYPKSTAAVFMLNVFVNGWMASGINFDQKYGSEQFAQFAASMGVGAIGCTLELIRLKVETAPDCLFDGSDSYIQGGGDFDVQPTTAHTNFLRIESNAYAGLSYLTLLQHLYYLVATAITSKDYFAPDSASRGTQQAAGHVWNAVDALSAIPAAILLTGMLLKRCYSLSNRRDAGSGVFRGSAIIKEINSTDSENSTQHSAQLT